MKIDLHNHTNASSDALTRPKEFVKAALKKGVTVIAVSDHNTMKAFHSVEKEARGKEISIIPGEEIMCKEGEIIGLFLYERISPGKSALEVLDEIKSQGALSYAPHPFDTMRHGIRKEEILNKIDIIEVYNSKAYPKADDDAMAFASKNGKLMGAGSDSHVAGEIGRAYVESPDMPVRSPEELIRALKKGKPTLKARTNLLDKVVRKVTIAGHRFLRR
ncbi:MAG: PHP domain-containing protein [Methanobacteriota archaeon]|nr:MAG: PHP domain-containing protein [Euryarchaeota archaeon]